jgi:hypothetical protein
VRPRLSAFRIGRFLKKRRVREEFAGAFSAKGQKAADFAEKRRHRFLMRFQNGAPKAVDRFAAWLLPLVLGTRRLTTARRFGF